jgi:hypothetical protein
MTHHSHSVTLLLNTLEITRRLTCIEFIQICLKILIFYSIKPNITWGDTDILLISQHMCHFWLIVCLECLYKTVPSLQCSAFPHTLEEIVRVYINCV